MPVIRLKNVIKEFNISLSRVVEFLESKDISIARDPNVKVDNEVYDILMKEFQKDKVIKEEVEKKIHDSQDTKVKEITKPEQQTSIPEQEVPPKTEEEKPKKQEVEELIPEQKEVETPSSENDDKSGLKILGKIELPTKKTIKRAPQKEVKPKEEPKKEEQEKETPQKTEVQADKIQKEESQPPKEVPVQDEVIKTQYQKLDGPKITGQKVDLSQFEKKKSESKDKKKKRKRIQEVKVDVNKTPQNKDASSSPKKLNKRPLNSGKGRFSKQRTAPRELSEEEVQNKIKETYEKLTSKGTRSKSAKYRKDKRTLRRENEAYEEELRESSREVNVTEFVTVNEFATLMDVSATEVISACFSLGIMVTMNQRLEADTLTLVAEEFGYKVNFVDAEIEESISDEEEDKEEDLVKRAPIVTVMGHVDHGKTSLLDYIRETNVIAGESGGITQHIGAYNVKLKNGERITFLDTPGHEAFTAMRARGAQVTDIVIIVIAADDDVMPQTKEAIAHAQAAGVPMIIAINKVDKPTANPDRIREQLSAMNILVEEWGGKYQSQEISAKFGNNVEDLLDKVLLEAEVLDLKANPDKVASGVVIEASLDKGRGYVSTILIQNGTLKVGDYVLAGKNHGKVRALLDERGHQLQKAGPASPATILGLDGAPTAGDKFKVFEDEREAKQLANKREQLQREQSLRTHKHITLNEIGRRIALGDFKELNIILKGDVDGSVEALTDALQKLSTEEIHVNIVHKGVGQISESDILLASASNAVVLGFNVRPSVNARDIADKEEIEIRYYSIIYDAIAEIKEAMEGMLSPEIKEQIIGNVEIREIFKISKVGTIAGCMVISGKVTRNSKIRVLREGIVIHDGYLESLKRFKDDVKEVTKNYECGLNIKGFNDIIVGDILEAYEEVEVKKKLK
ncbi:MAG: translation initiation factor IF-2 [Flavobacteriales bacterium]|nr:translation initiation factor IF-2 [Flavobacteriales bacterium]